MSKAEPDGAGKVIAAIDSSAAARPVLSAAMALGEMLGASTEALHVEEGRSDAIRAAAGLAGLPIRVVKGAPAERVALATAETDVVALVVGARATPGGRRPVGGTAIELIRRTGKPVSSYPRSASTRYSSAAG